MADAPPVPEEHELTEQAATLNAEAEPEGVVTDLPEPPVSSPAFPLPAAGEWVIDAGQVLTAEDKTSLATRIKSR